MSTLKTVVIALSLVVVIMVTAFVTIQYYHSHHNHVTVYEYNEGSVKKMIKYTTNDNIWTKKITFVNNERVSIFVRNSDNPSILDQEVLPDSSYVITYNYDINDPSHPDISVYKYSYRGHKLFFNDNHAEYICSYCE